MLWKNGNKNVYICVEEGSEEEGGSIRCNVYFSSLARDTETPRCLYYGVHCHTSIGTPQKHIPP